MRAVAVARTLAVAVACGLGASACVKTPPPDRPTTPSSPVPPGTPCYLDPSRPVAERVQDLLAKDMPLIPIYNSNMIYVSRSYVKGFKAHSVEYNLGFAETWLDK